MSAYPGPPTGNVHATPQGRELTIERAFRATVEEVWASLTEPKQVAKWYGRIDGEQLPGKTITITMTFKHHLADDLDAADVGAGWEFYADRHDAAFHGNAMPDWDTDRYQEILGPHYDHS